MTSVPTPRRGPAVRRPAMVLRSGTPVRATAGQAGHYVADLGPTDRVSFVAVPPADTPGGDLVDGEHRPGRTTS